jgi:hypothetical protein
MKGSNARVPLRCGVVGLIATVVALAAGAFPRTGFSFCNQDTPGNFLQCTNNLGGHVPITRQGLGFLRPTVMADILDENVFMDTTFGLTGSRHFDGCDFQGGSQFIRDQYANEVLAELDPANPQPFDATDEFGQLLHTAHDFYSHSNWVELGRSDLLDSGLVNWTVITPFTQIRPGLVVAQGESLPAGWSIVTTGKTPTVNDNVMPPNTFQALISGVFGLSDDCHDSLAVNHGSPSNAADPGLNKDDPVRPGYVVAQSLAAQQTAHEWCRLLHQLKTLYGFPGPSIPLALWVAPGKNPHVGATCRLGTPGPIKVKVTIKSIKVLDDTDPFPFAAGELNFVFMLYTGDFTRSARSDVGMFSISSGSSLSAQQLPKMLTLCLRADETLVMTVQGWDDDNSATALNGVFDDSGEDTNTTDEALRGVTLAVTGPGFGAGVHKVTSSDLEVEFDITVTPP